MTKAQLKEMKDIDEQWAGKDFVDWCASDVEDDRTIHYTLNIHEHGKWRKEMFTSEDTVPLPTMRILRDSTIKNIELADNEWRVELECYTLF